MVAGLNILVSEMCEEVVVLIDNVEVETNLLLVPKCLRSANILLGTDVLENRKVQYQHQENEYHFQPRLSNQEKPYKLRVENSIMEE